MSRTEIVKLIKKHLTIIENHPVESSALFYVKALAEDLCVAISRNSQIVTVPVDIPRNLFEKIESATNLFPEVGWDGFAKDAFEDHLQGLRACDWETYLNDPRNIESINHTVFGDDKEPPAETQ